VTRGLALMLAMSAVVPARAQVQPVPPVPALSHLPASVRVAGLAGAGVAMPGYASGIFDNPANIGPIRTLSLEAAYARLPDDSWYTTGAAAARVKMFNLGAGYRYLRYYDAGPIRDNLSWSGAGVWRVKGIALGGSVNTVAVEDSGGTIYRTVTSDAGVTLAFFEIAAIGLTFHNLGRYGIRGPELSLPSNTHLGFSLNLIDSYSTGRLLATVETVWTESAGHRTIFGLEGGAVFHGVGLIGRIGTGPPPANSTMSRNAYGASLVLSRARLDYAYQAQSAVGRSIHLVGVRWTP
jgi:hypothetical protein